MPITVNCHFCGRLFLIKPYQKSVAKFCSRQCLGKARIPEREIPRLAALRGKKPHNFAGVSITCRHCGKNFGIPPSRLGIKKYCSNLCYSNAQRCEVKPLKYKRITVNGVRVLEHRYVMECKLGRKLVTKEEVHHKNRNRHDNSPENLEVLDKKIHGSLSSKSRKDLCQQSVNANADSWEPSSPESAPARKHKPE